MATSRATTVGQYLQQLPAERRQVIAAVRSAVKRRLPKGYRETMQYGMISYVVPESKLAETYNGQPLCYVGLAAQKNYNALYLTGPYAVPSQREALERGFFKAGKKLDMGQSCVRFRSVDDLALDAIGDVISSMPVDDFISGHHRARSAATAVKPSKAPKRSRPATRATQRQPRG